MIDADGGVRQVGIDSMWHRDVISKCNGLHARHGQFVNIFNKGTSRAWVLLYGR